jgi:G8 domain
MSCGTKGDNTMSIRPRAARKALSRLTAASLFLAAMAASTLSGTAAADQNLFRLGFPTGGHNPPGTPLCPGAITPNSLPQGGGKAPGQVADLPILASCNATISTAGTYYFDQINIAGDKASLTITEPTTTNKNIIIWASSIIIENGGTLQAGTPSDPYGNNGGTLTIYLYGKDLSGGNDPSKSPGLGALCNGKLDITKQIGPCGIPWKAWSDNGQSPTALDGDATVGGVTDFFYQYGPLPGDGKCTDGTIWDPTTQCNNKTNAANQVGYFGYKVLAVSYGGTLNLFGYKGTVLAQKVPTRVTSFRNPFSAKTEQGGHDVTNSSRSGPSGNTQNAGRFFRFFGQPQPGNNGGGSGSGGGNGVGGGNPLQAGPTPACAKTQPDTNPLGTGCSWLRLVGDLTTTANTLKLSSAVGDKWWTDGEVGDQMVVTTTDYLPGHSELLTIDKVSDDTVTFHTDSKSTKPRWLHSGLRYQIGSRLGTNVDRFTKAGLDPGLIENGAETRAAVALLTRSIRIVSGGDNVKDDFEKADLPAGAATAAKCQSVADPIPDAPTPKPPEITCYKFGAHVVFRQGFKEVQIQGVEFAKMGQPGKMGHYPLHFHMARQVPTTTSSRIHRSTNP